MRSITLALQSCEWETAGGQTQKGFRGLATQLSMFSDRVEGGDDGPTNGDDSNTSWNESVECKTVRRAG
jgi:hypothetical protein